MFSAEAELFFESPRKCPAFPNWFGVLYLLRRDVDQCMGLNPNTGGEGNCQALWPAAMGLLAGFDLLGKFFAGSDARGAVGDRFRNFLERFCPNIPQGDRQVVYQLRNSLLHSFGLYSEDRGQVYRFTLTADGSGPLVAHEPPDKYMTDLRVLHREFEAGVESYATALDRDPRLQANFNSMFEKYGRVHIG